MSLITESSSHWQLKSRFFSSLLALILGIHRHAAGHPPLPSKPRKHGETGPRGTAYPPLPPGGC